MDVILVQDEDGAPHMNMSPKMLAAVLYKRDFVFLGYVLVLDPGGSITTPAVKGKNVKRVKRCRRFGQSLIRRRKMMFSKCRNREKHLGVAHGLTLHFKRRGQLTVRQAVSCLQVLF